MGEPANGCCLCSLHSSYSLCFLKLQKDMACFFSWNKRASLDQAKLISFASKEAIFLYISRTKQYLVTCAVNINRTKWLTLRSLKPALLPLMELVPSNHKYFVFDVSTFLSENIYLSLSSNFLDFME